MVLGPPKFLFFHFLKSFNGLIHKTGLKLLKEPNGKWSVSDENPSAFRKRDHISLLFVPAFDEI